MKTYHIATEDGERLAVTRKSDKRLFARLECLWYHSGEIKYKSEATEGDCVFLHIPKTGGTSFRLNVLHNPKMRRRVAIYHRVQWPPPRARFDILNTDSRTAFAILRERASCWYRRTSLSCSNRRRRGTPFRS